MKNECGAEKPGYRIVLDKGRHEIRMILKEGGRYWFYHGGPDDSRRCSTLSGLRADAEDRVAAFFKPTLELVTRSFLVEKESEL